MNILYDNFIFDLQQAGGISNLWCKLIQGLQNRNYTNLTFVEGRGNRNIFRKALAINNRSTLRENSHSLALRKFKKIPNNGYDIYHSSYYRPLKNKGNTKVVVTIHDFIYEKFSGYIPKIIHIYLKKRSLRQADAIICVSENTRQDFYKHFPNMPKNSIHVVYNGVDELFKPIDRSKLININGQKFENGKFLLYVGNRGYAKNFEFVLQLMSSTIVKEMNLRLVCVGGGLVSAKELNKLKKLNLTDNIIFLTNVSSTHLNILYNHAFSLLFPSIYEGFGIPIVEAMKASCPIWTTNSASVKELIGPYYPASFDPKNWQEAEKAFRKLCNSKTRKKAIEVGLKQSKTFSWNRCVDETTEIYQNLLRDA
jgi:glycosyltransferase involved in cell wall biosynthesis